jgi:halocyanin-like protein
MASGTPRQSIGRRRFIQATTALAVGGTALANAPSARAQADTDLDSWFEGVSNYDGVVDERGASTVTIEVGADGNGGGFAFGPAAVRVDPGTSVVWEWTGEGGMHNVSAKDGAYESELVDAAGETFERVFETEVVSQYVCVSHETMGMKGAIVVGDVDVGADTADPEYVSREPDYGDWFDGVPGFDGTVDLRGREEVQITIAAGEDGMPTFSPAAVHVDPGTRVIWTWEDGAEHSVTAADESYASPAKTSGKWGLVFDGTGISKYASATATDTVRGAVVVGDVFGSIHEVSTTQLSILGALGAALLSPLAFAAFLWTRRSDDQSNHYYPNQRRPRQRT